MKLGPALAAVRTLSSRAERTGLGGAGLQDSARSANIFFMRSAQGFKERTGHSAFCGVLPSDSLAPARSTEELRIKLPMWTPGLVPTTTKASSYRKLWTLSDYEDIGYDDECGRDGD